jgi:hypothetical protein
MVLVASATLMAVSRIWAVRRGYVQFRLPGRLLAVGAGILALNLALPLRLQAVVRAGTVTDWEPYNDAFWLAALPLLVLSLHLLPRPAHRGSLPPERPWLPLVIAGIWIGATGIHGWSCAYIGKQPMTAAFLAPATAAVAWLLVSRLEDFVPVPTSGQRLSAWGCAATTPFLALGHDRIFPMLACLGAAALARQATLHPAAGRTLRAAAGLSFLAALVGLPIEWIQAIPGIGGRGAWMLATAGTVAVVASLLRPSAQIGLVAGAFIGGGVLASGGMADANLALQAGLAWTAVHSLLWRKGEQPGQDAVRLFILGMWLLAAWNRHPSAVPSPTDLELAAGSGLALAWACTAWRLGWGRLLTVPATAAILVFTRPAGWIVEHGPAGLLALAGSLVLFAGGCLLAWTRCRWER